MVINEFFIILFTYRWKINPFSGLRAKVLASVVCT
jgi:hypothetical protein